MCSGLSVFFPDTTGSIRSRRTNPGRPSARDYLASLGITPVDDELSGKKSRKGNNKCVLFISELVKMVTAKLRYHNLVAIVVNTSYA